MEQYYGTTTWDKNLAKSHRKLQRNNNMENQQQGTTMGHPLTISKYFSLIVGH